MPSLVAGGSVQGRLQPPSSLGLQQSSTHSRSDNSIFGGVWEGEHGPSSSMVEKDRVRVEKLLNIFRGMHGVVYRVVCVCVFGIKYGTNQI